MSIGERKKRIKGGLAHGDLAKAAREAGITRVSFREWMEKVTPSSRDVKYLGIIERIVMSREIAFDEAASRVEAALGSRATQSEF